MKKVLPLLLLLLPFIFGYISSTARASSSTVVISEVQIAGANVNEDFIELYNMSDTDYDLNGHRLVKRSASGSTDTSIKAWDSETILPAHSYYLWANNSWTPSVAADASTAATLAAENGIALRNGPADTGEIIDSLAWGSTVTNVFVESTPFPTNPESLTSLVRVGQDTDNNSVDFIISQSPDPQNLSTTPSPTPTVTASPTVSPTPTGSPSPTPSESPTQSPTSTPTSSPTSTPTVEPSPTVSPTPSESPTPSPSVTPSPTPTVTASPTVSPTPTSTPTSTPHSLVLARFGFGNNVRICRLVYNRVWMGFIRVSFPRIVCSY